MPPPAAADSWLISRRFGLVVDAGSSGSRLQIYSWKDARFIRKTLHYDELDGLPRVEKGVLSGDEWLRKVEPGLSSLANNLTGIPTYLGPLLEHAKETVPPSLHRETPIFLLATAGMRLLPEDKQRDIIEATCMFFRANSNFRLDAPSEVGSCGSNVRIISGEEEGIFGWIAVNYLMDGFVGHDQNHRATYGFLDMGGASAQIAFEPSAVERNSMSRAIADTLIDVRLRLLNGEEINHPVFVTTWLGYGTNQAHERYVQSQIQKWKTFEHGPAESIPDPCLPKNLEMDQSPHAEPDLRTKQSHQLIGTGSFEQCLKQTAPLLSKDRPCPVVSCLFNGVPAPRIDFSLSKFIGVSEYWYSSEHVFGLGGAYDVVQYERAATTFCSREWADIIREYKETRFDEFGKAVPPGRWGKEVGLGRLKLQCFKAAWVVNVLHEGIGLPRIMDPGGNKTTGEADTVNEKAEAKGLGPSLVGLPTFQSVDMIGDTAVSWTLGKMVLEASKEVPPLTWKTPPLLDPNPNRQPSWTESISGDGRLSMIYVHLTSTTLYPVYVLLIFLCLFLVHILRRRILPTIVMPWRSRRRYSGESHEVLHMEEGAGGNLPFSSRPGTPGSATFTPKPSNSLKSVYRIFVMLSGSIRHKFAYSRSLYRGKPVRSAGGTNHTARPLLSHSRTEPTGFSQLSESDSWMSRGSSTRSFSSDTVVAPSPGQKMQFANTTRPPLVPRMSGSVSPSLSQQSSIVSSRAPSIRVMGFTLPSDHGYDSDPNQSAEELEYDYIHENDGNGGNLTSRHGPPVSPSGRLAALGSSHGQGSRNSSQLNLTLAVPRTPSVSRFDH